MNKDKLLALVDEYDFGNYQQWDFGKNVFCIEVWGEYALFNHLAGTNAITEEIPSYSACESIIGTIFHHPGQIRIIPIRIDVMCDVNNKRNISYNGQSQMNGNLNAESVNFRNMTMIVNPRYRIYFKMEIIPFNERDKKMNKNGFTDDMNIMKYKCEFVNRASRGLKFEGRTLYLGDGMHCRALYRLVNPSEKPTPVELNTKERVWFYTRDYKKHKNIRFKGTIEHGVFDFRNGQILKLE